ncbi:unnamed protein product [Oncorhynchus mykiss]|uniref:Uncharacterized protein n=1 Tax=Oncorhynchus mykiss TaxID=8022 RepID=A0A060XQY7_ONCMY|nr:unnamed protein product [Oncorhynchus mykiss]
MWQKVAKFKGAEYFRKALYVSKKQKYFPRFLISPTFRTDSSKPYNLYFDCLFLQLMMMLFNESPWAVVVKIKFNIVSYIFLTYFWGDTYRDPKN